MRKAHMEEQLEAQEQQIKDVNIRVALLHQQVSDLQTMVATLKVLLSDGNPTTSSPTGPVTLPDE